MFRTRASIETESRTLRRHDSKRHSTRRRTSRAPAGRDPIRGSAESCSQPHRPTTTRHSLVAATTPRPHQGVQPALGSPRVSIESARTRSTQSSRSDPAAAAAPHYLRSARATLPSLFHAHNKPSCTSPKKPHVSTRQKPRAGSLRLSTLVSRLSTSHQPVFFTTYRGLITAAAPRSLALNRSTMSLLNSASLPSGAWVTVIGQFSM